MLVLLVSRGPCPVVVQGSRSFITCRTSANICSCLFQCSLYPRGVSERSVGHHTIVGPREHSALPFRRDARVSQCSSGSRISRLVVSSG